MLNHTDPARRSIAWIANHIGVSTTVIGNLARHYGIRSRRPKEFRHLDAIDRD